jgi:hypothetical protein
MSHMQAMDSDVDNNIWEQIILKCGVNVQLWDLPMISYPFDAPANN